MFLGFCFCYFSLYPILLVHKIENEQQARKIWTLVFMFSFLYGLEELIITTFEFAITLLLAFITLGVTSLYPTFKSHKILDPSLKFYPKRLYLSLSIMLSAMVYYGSIHEKCSKPEAFENFGCPFPDYFNHNAVLHVVLLVGMYGVNGSFNAS